MKIDGDYTQPGYPKLSVLTVREVAEQMGVSGRTVINIFEKESGTILIARPETLHKRKYRSVRIPRAVFERVLRRYTV